MVVATGVALLARPEPAVAQLSPTTDSIATLRAELEQVAGTGDSLLVAGALERLGRAYWRADRFADAITFLLSARHIVESRGERESVARISNALGSSHYHLGNYELALQSYVRALEIRVADGNALGQAYVHANIAKAYQDWGQLEQALARADSAVALADSAQHSAALGYTLNTRADILADLKRHAEARESAERSLAAYYSGSPSLSRADSLSAWSLNVMVLGDADIAEGRAVDALRRFTEIYDRARQSNTRRGQAQALLAMGRAQEALARHADARASYAAAERDAEYIGNRTYRLEALEGLSRTAERLGDATEALRFARRHDALRDSVFNARSAQRVAAIELEAEALRQRAATAALAAEQEAQADDLRQQRRMTVLYAALLVLALAFVLAQFRVNRRVRQRESELAASHAELQRALAEVQALSGLIPICASCKNVRDDAGFWRSVEEYVGSRSAAHFSHSICNACGPKLYGDDWEPSTGASAPEDTAAPARTPADQPPAR
jgi:tetratricopeptide (TPR) repeat protein